MNQELSTTLAAEIQAQYLRAKEAANTARENVGHALHAAADVGLLIDKAKDIYKHRLHEWLREQVKGITVEEADAYLGLHKVRSKRTCLEIDSRQLKLIGITGDDETHQQGSSTGERAGGNRWIKWTSHIVQHFREVDSTRPIE